MFQSQSSDSSDEDYNPGETKRRRWDASKCGTSKADSAGKHRSKSTGITKGMMGKAVGGTAMKKKPRQLVQLVLLQWNLLLNRQHP